MREICVHEIALLAETEMSGAGAMVGIKPHIQVAMSTRQSSIGSGHAHERRCELSVLLVPERQIAYRVFRIVAIPHIDLRASSIVRTSPSGPCPNGIENLLRAAGEEDGSPFPTEVQEERRILDFRLVSVAKCLVFAGTYQLCR
jgi:hypothetical protein